MSNSPRHQGLERGFKPGCQAQVIGSGIWSAVLRRILRPGLGSEAESAMID